MAPNKKAGLRRPFRWYHGSAQAIARLIAPRLRRWYRRAAEGRALWQQTQRSVWSTMTRACWSLGSVLRSFGWKVASFASADDFIERYARFSLGCVLLDITMPLMTGPRVQQHLNQLRIGVPVITVSARDDEETRSRARTLGARMFLRKAVDDQALLDAINRVSNPINRS